MKKTVYSVQALRAIAATMVVIFHAQALMSVYEARVGLPQALLNSTAQLKVIGASGVDIFFVISGFVMAYITVENRKKSGQLRPFLKRRFIRIIPVYWFYTSIMVGLLFFAPQLFATAKFSLAEALLSYLFIPYTPTVNPTWPLLQVGWTLSYEMYFYLLVAIGLFFSQRQFCMCLGGFFCVSYFFGDMLPFPDSILTLLTNPILFEFYAGFLCGVFYTSGCSVYKMIPRALFVAGIFGYILWGMGLTSIPLGCFAVLGVSGFVFCERQTNIKFPRTLLAVGDSSYTLYLSHFLLLPAIGKICTAFDFWHIFSPEIFIVFATVACVIAGHIMYIAIEKPVIRWLSNNKHPRKTILLPS